MQKWEYLRVVFGPGMRPLTANGNPLEWEEGDYLHDHLNRWGDQGWELVSEIAHGEDREHTVMLFKRPKG